MIRLRTATTNTSRLEANRTTGPAGATTFCVLCVGSPAEVGAICGNVVAVTPASIVLAVALVAWGPVAPAPEAETSDAAAPPKPATGVEPIAPSPPAAAPSPPAAAPSPPAAAAPPAAPTPAPAATPAPIQTSIIAKAPLEVRATPTLVATPAAQREPARPLYKHWLFWTLAGGFFLTTIVVTIVATRPGPQPYTGNAPPYYVPFQ